MNEAQLDSIINHSGTLHIGGAPEGFQPLVLADMARASQGRVVYIARDASAATALCNMLGFFAPNIEVIYLPAWDCLPYDRLSPQVAIMSARMAALAFSLFCFSFSAASCFLSLDFSFWSERASLSLIFFS